MSILVWFSIFWFWTFKKTNSSWHFNSNSRTAQVKVERRKENSHVIANVDIHRLFSFSELAMNNVRSKKFQLHNLWSFVPSFLVVRSFIYQLLWAIEPTFDSVFIANADYFVCFTFYLPIEKAWTHTMNGIKRYDSTMARLKSCSVIIL